MVSDTSSRHSPLIWLVFLVIVIDLIGFGLVIPLLPFMAPSLGGDSTDVAFIMITYALGAALVSPAWGRLSDKSGRRQALVLALLCSCIAYIVTALADTLWQVYLGRALSGLGTKGIKDTGWSSGFVKIATATKAPVLPIFVKGRNSIFFYSLSFLAKPLSAAWLIREMFKQSHRTIDARVGCPVPHEVYTANDFSAQKVASLFRKHVYRLGRGAKPLFKTIETVAPAESKLLVRRELQACEVLGKTHDDKTIYLTQMSESPCVMREIGRLREMTFRLVGEGSGMPRDLDRYDRTYLQLVLWDDTEREIAGAYRLGRTKDLVNAGGLDALYTHSLFHFGSGMEPFLAQGLELGRSFVQPKYQNKHALDYLWCGLGAYVKKHPEIRYLFGPASISRLYGTEGISRLMYFYVNYFSDLKVDVAARNPFTIPGDLLERLQQEFGGIDYEQDSRALKEALAEQGLSVPILFKHYAHTTESDGVAFTAFNIDPDFADCVDAFVLVDLHKLTSRKRKRYLDRETLDGGDSAQR